MRKLLLAATAAMAAMLTFAGVDAASAQTSKPRLYVGSLSCNDSGGGGFIFGSTKELTCVFVSAAGKSALFHGTINKFGIDIGQSKPIHTVWQVYTLGSDRGPGALAGDFTGSQESLTVGSGAGGSALIGGQDNEIVLQSVAVEQNAGFNFADGLAHITLRAGR